MAVPTRPADERIDDVGTYYNAPTDPNKFKIDNSLANQEYIAVIPFHCKYFTYYARAM